MAGWAKNWRELPVMEAASCWLREILPADAAPLAEALGRADAVRSRSGGPVTPEAFGRFVDQVRLERLAGRGVCFAVLQPATGTPVGLFHLWPAESSGRDVEWEFGLARACRDTKLFFESAALIIDWAFSAIGAGRLEARVRVQNRPVEAALRKLGAHGERGTANIAIWTILASDWTLLRGADGLDARDARALPAGDPLGLALYGDGIGGRG